MLHHIVNPNKSAKSIQIYTVSQKTIHLTFGHNFYKCGPIYIILLLSDSWGNYVHTYHKHSPTHLKHISALPSETRKLQSLPK